MPISAPPLPARRRRLDPADRRDEILEAATRVFAAQPYVDVSMAEIAREAGASRALVSHYFEDKAGVFAAVFARFARLAAQTVRVDRQLPPAEMVAANTEAFLAFADEHRETVLALLPTGPVGSDRRLQQIADAMRDALVDRMLVNHFGTTDVPAGHRLALRAYTGLFAIALGDLLRNPELSREDAAAFLARTLLDIVAELRTK
ncbi:TetR/AcrR family transcriptional regulator [Capillimicrobium parvum]|uniref:TetR/AcrR family transcriptional regulator n=1 Tax=Capillimicrobium parvum TaxID=2884022 RepID=UPI00216B4EF2|nr:TetR/AcrR family transcriptional regulator [Capillimicrobium parvum]